MDNWLLWIVQLAITLLIGGITWFVQRTMASYEKRLEKLEKEVQALPLQYTLKDEFLRFSARVENKLDKIIESIGEMKRRSE